MQALLPLVLQFLPQLLASPAVQQQLPALITVLLHQVGTTAFPGIDPAKAPAAAVTLFDTNSIMWVQAYLNSKGESLILDGVLKDADKLAIRKFQTVNGLTVDGWPGKDTQSSMRNSLVPQLDALRKT